MISFYSFALQRIRLFETFYLIYIGAEAIFKSIANENQKASNS